MPAIVHTMVVRSLSISLADERGFRNREVFTSDTPPIASGASVRQRSRPAGKFNTTDIPRMTCSVRGNLLHSASSGKLKPVVAGRRKASCHSLASFGTIGNAAIGLESASVAGPTFRNPTKRSSSSAI
jgi:hypothetical protein